MKMVTDPQRIRRNDPGDPDVCNVFSLHKVFSTPEEVESINHECRRAGIGCVQCKQLFAKNLNKHLEPFREKRAQLDRHPDDVMDILREGQQRASVIAEKTINEVKDAIGLP